MRWAISDHPGFWQWFGGPFSAREWHRFFAWRPVKIDGQRVWLEWVERKGEDIGDDYGCGYTEWTYREADPINPKRMIIWPYFADFIIFGGIAAVIVTFAYRLIILS